MPTPLQINMGGNTVFTTTAGIKFADGTEQDTAATGGGGGNATAIQGTAVSSTPPDHNGELLIYDSVQNKYVPGDPLVQGLFPEGTATSSINPVLVSGKGIDGNQHDLSVDNTGAIAVSNFPATQPVSGTVGVSNFPATQATSSTQLPAVLDGSGFLKVHEQGTVSVTGTFFQTTQPVSGTVTANAGSGTFVVDASGHTVPVSGTVAINNFPATQPVSGTVTANAGSGTFAVSAASLPLPSGASTSAKQPALGTAGVASADVITVQGVASMTALKVDGSAVTQPVSGTFFQATQPVSGTVAVNNFPATQPISGAVSFTAPQHVITDNTSVTAITSALPVGANTIGKVDILGNAGAILDGVITAATAPANGLASLVVYNTTQPALTNGQSVATQCDSTGSQYVNMQGRQTTYSAATGATATAGAGVVLQIVGSATKTVRITRIHITGFLGSAAQTTFKVQRTSAAATSGTSAALTAGKADSGDANATAVITHWTATGGTTGSVVGGPYVSDSAWLPSTTFAAPGSLGHDRMWVFGDSLAAKPLTLRGTADFMTLTSSATIAASQVWVEWTEE